VIIGTLSSHPHHHEGIAEEENKRFRRHSIFEQESTEYTNAELSAMNYSSVSNCTVQKTRVKKPEIFEKILLC
jgi:hypothetical protein